MLSSAAVLVLLSSAGVMGFVPAPQQAVRSSQLTMAEKPAKGEACPVCGWIHDAGLTQIKIAGADPISLSGLLPDIVRLVHRAHEKGLAGVSTKDDTLVKICGGYKHPCKAFDDLNQRAAYKLLFDTSRRGFISLRGAVGRNRNKSESNPE